MRKKVLFIDREQFGSLTDSLKYCEYMNNSYDIEYLCFDKKRPKIKLSNIEVHYVPAFKPRVLRAIIFIIIAIIKCLFYKGKIFVLYFPKCETIKKILFWKKIHIDIRTLSVIKDEEKRKKENLQICNCINKFDSVSIISQPIADSINIKSSIKQYILPLGADIISKNEKSFNTIKLLYIGTLENRDIIKTVQGLELFIKKNPSLSISYDIVGDGCDFDIINNYILEHRLDTYVRMYGRVPYKELKPFLDSHNVGVSFVPMTTGYDLQPPTKTYEYILSGLFCIATNTRSNNDVIINDVNGYLIEDSASSFFKALEHIYNNKDNYYSELIRKTLLDYQWHILVDKYLRPILED